MKSLHWATGPLLLALAACSSQEQFASPDECFHQLTAGEVEQGWELLFDGSDLGAWRGYKMDSVPAGWESENGCLTLVDSQGDILTRARYANFELKLEWRISEAGNSGIFIRGDESGPGIAHTGMEMQVLDNAGHLDRFWESHRAGAYYDMIAPPADTTQPPGYWNQVHIIARGPDIEFWLNGMQTAAFSVGSGEWEALYQASKYHDRPGYGRLSEGHIALQDHWDKVWYRNIRVLRLPD